MNILLLRKIIFKIFCILINIICKFKGITLQDQQYYKRFFKLLRQIKKSWYYNIGNTKVFYDPTLSAIGQRIYFDGAFEETYLKICSQYLKRDSIIFDIGANIGIHSVFFSNIALDGKIYSFEPSLSTYQLLLKNTFSHKNIIPINSAVSDQTSITRFFDCDDNALSSLKDTQRSNIQSTYDVLCYKLDDFLDFFPISKLDFIKIDVEGFEYEVLRGMKNAVMKFKPIIFCEVYGGKNSNKNPEATLKYIEDLNYKVFNITESGMIEYKVHLDNEPNYLFVPK